MYRLARTGGSPELLRRLARRADGWAGLLDGDGTVLQAASGTSRWPGQDAAALATRAARELTTRGARAYSVETGERTVLLLPLDGTGAERPPFLLAVVAPRPVPGGLATLLADAAMPLSVAWSSESVERKRRRVDLAEFRGREAVLHLLMTGQLSIAHQVAGALRPRLPDPVRVCVVECSGGQRDEVARICAEASGGRTWIVRCPVYARHLILITPAAEAGPDGARDGTPLDRTVADLVADCVVGVSEDVPLSDTAAAYRQAFHALAVARGLPDRHARFGSAPEPALVVGAAGARWADALLAPLLTHLPRRSQDPGSHELAATLASWLAFSSHATQHLKIHRNTLAARLRLIGDLLGTDLNRLADQAALDLALCVRALPARHRPDGRQERAAAPDLDAVLRAPGVQSWAAQRLRQLAPAGRTAEETVRTWLRCEAQLGPTAAELGISVPGARKRIVRLEGVLHRSLLRAPSARYDLWLAFRAADLVA
ncbi:helix-turn-helix domain-containing protein [Streptomyces sp. NBC_01754]|uniref:helix-turn-helix domain-containing protein n=1 Tax=Streptomyces sp. NBC_01754 TaxID=2975930 RepID=UPI002DDA6B8A|nr:helix-turn-helix domain-containing protein [Streptomyces sp. NBC_01754]WSC96850.1 helix-turn-helix domain-containing protein [Streptomyces sp. NBC_01754]